MSNAIIQLQNSYPSIEGETLFVKATFFYIPFFNPSTDTYKTYFNSSEFGSFGDEFQLLDVQYDALNHPTFKILHTGLNTIDISQLEDLVMGTLQMISANVTRLYGIAISVVFKTSDNNWPSDDASSPVGSDIGKQAEDVAKQIGDAAKKAASALPSSSTIIIILIILVIGIIGIGYVIHEV